MQLGRIVGKVWATRKDPGLESQRFLIVQPVTADRRDTGKRLICVDAVGTGAGEWVYWCRGKEASFPFLPAEVPVEATIVGIVDEVHAQRPK